MLFEIVIISTPLAEDDVHSIGEDGMACRAKVYADIRCFCIIPMIFTINDTKHASLLSTLVPSGFIFIFLGIDKLGG